MSHYKLIVFDWEDTIEDSLGRVLNTLEIIAKNMHLGELDYMLAKKYLNLGLNLVIKQLFPHLSNLEYAQCLQTLQYTLCTQPTKVYLFKGLKALLEHAHKNGIILAIASNKSQQALQHSLQLSGLNNFFSITRAAGQTLPKPSPQMLTEIMSTYDINPSHTLMIGDSINDIAMAKCLNVDAIGFDFYNQQSATLSAGGAIEVFDDYTKLAKYLGFLE